MPAIRHEIHFGRVTPCFVDRPANLDASLRAAVARAGNSIAVVCGERRVSYSELDRNVSALAAALADLGIETGDRIALLLENRLEFLVILYACARIGAVAVPMNIRHRMPENEYALNQSGAKLFFHEANLAANIPAAEAVPELAHRIAIDDDGAALAAMLQSASPRSFDPVPEEAPISLLYTSGTTGQPKGAILTHLNLVHSILHFQHHYGMREGERSLLAVPASHVTGLVALLAATIHVAGCSILMREFKAKHFLELAANERMTYTLMVPAMYALALMEPGFAEYDLSHWRIGGFGGAPMPQSIVAELASSVPGLQLFNTYGATETTSPAVIMPPGEGRLRMSQLGKPVITCDLRVMDDDGCEVPAGTPGEIWMAGPMVIPGYWNNTDATAASFVGGYWKSGDIGSVDADGYVSVFDRKKDMINRGGFKIYSVEVENLLASHPKVLEAAVVGRPCPVLGERVEAFVHLSGAVDTQSLRIFCAESLSDYKVPERIHVWDKPLPRNANGKLLKSELRSGPAG